MERPDPHPRSLKKPWGLAYPGVYPEMAATAPTISALGGSVVLELMVLKAAMAATDDGVLQRMTLAYGPLVLVYPNLTASRYHRWRLESWRVQLVERQARRMLQR